MKRPGFIRFSTVSRAPRWAGGMTFLLAVLMAVSAGAAEEFGDISVSPNAIYTGNTYHGYAEIRVVLENQSSTKPHVVTLVYPNNDAYGNYGNCISRLSRTVSLPAGAREVVTLLQPPLPVHGDGAIRVVVDGRHEGEVRAPNANNHCNYYSRGIGSMTETVFVSRSLDFDAVTHLFQANQGTGAFTAARAIGAPDATGGAGGFQPNCWMPDVRSYGRTNWLELDYTTPQNVNRIVVHGAQPTPGANILLLGAGGTNVARLSLAGARQSYSGSGWVMDLSVPLTSVPVKTVRLDFGTTPAGIIAIDAVQVAGPTGSQWAAGARASSDNSAMGRYRGGAVHADDAETLRAESPVSEWSENWLAYSPFDAVVLSDADLAALPPPVFAALGDYVQAGGNLVVLGRKDLPAAWHSARTTELPGGAEFVTGFGSVLAFGGGSAAALEPGAVQRLREVVRDTSRYFEGLPNDSGAANGVMPVVENVQIPMRGVVIVMLAFVIVIGPVNMIYLSRIRRRTWMLWTIPAISFATTLLVFAYSLVREGITPDTRIRGLTVLDQTSHQAATIGGEAFYCPLTPGGGLHFEPGTEATPLVNGAYGRGTPREVDWTQSQHFQRGWVAARVPEHFHLRKAETRRERIQVINENGKLQVVNSLGAPIRSLWVADAELNIYQAEHVAAGEKGGLILSRPPPSAERSGANGLLRDIGFAARTEGLGDAAGKYLLPNTYIAVLDGNPFLENGLGTPHGKRTQSSAVVFGLLETPEIAGGGR